MRYYHRSLVLVYLLNLVPFAGIRQGLANVVFPDQPSFCLVSNGAECMLIDRRFYLDNCPPELSRRLKVEVSKFCYELKTNQKHE